MKHAKWVVIFLTACTTASVSIEPPLATAQSHLIVLDIMCGDTLELYTISESGSDRRRITDFGSQGAWAAHPYWSPDGGTIAFNVIWRSDGRHRSELYAISPNGSNLRPLTRTPSGKSSWSVTWAPDGQRIAFVSDRDGNADIYVMRLDDTGIKRLTTSTGDGQHAWNPDWSPDGRHIAFNANWGGNDQIHLLEISTPSEEPHRVSRVGHQRGLPTEAKSRSRPTEMEKMSYTS
jgi:Tol biopolymer transport system component